MTDDYYTPEREAERRRASRRREHNALMQTIREWTATAHEEHPIETLNALGYEVIATERRRALEELPGAYDTLRFCDQMEERG